MLALLCLGIRVNAIGMSQDAIEASKSKTMIASLVESELDLKVFKAENEDEEDDTTNS